MILVDLVITYYVTTKCKVLEKPRISDHYIIKIQGVLNSTINKETMFSIKGKLDYGTMNELLKKKYENRKWWCYWCWKGVWGEKHWTNYSGVKKSG